MTGAAAGRTSPAYQTMLVVLLGINMGAVILDRNAFSLLAPMIQPEFGLNNAQVGLVNGALAATWALSSFGLCRLADMTGRSKQILIVATLVFSLASISSGLAIGLLTLVAARALMGLAEGGLPPVSTHIAYTEVAPERRGLAVGTLSTIGLNLVPLLGPLVIVGIGTHYGWRHAFWLAGIPGLILAALMWALIRPPREARREAAPKGSFLPLFRIRNIRISMALAIIQMTGIVGIIGFVPLYLVKVLGLSETMMGAVMTTAQTAMVAYGFIAPLASDRFGRKPAIIGCYLLSVPGYLLLAFSGGALPLVFAGAALIGAFMGASILVMNAIAGESAPPHLSATAMGLNAAVGEMLGAGAMPIAIGWLADRVGLGMLPWFFLGLAALFCVVTLALTETAPRRSRAAATAIA